MNKELSQQIRAKGVRISETRHDQINPITWKVQFMLMRLLSQKLIRRERYVPILWKSEMAWFPLHGKCHDHDRKTKRS